MNGGSQETTDYTHTHTAVKSWQTGLFPDNYLLMYFPELQWMELTPDYFCIPLNTIVSRQHICMFNISSTPLVCSTEMGRRNTRNHQLLLFQVIDSIIYLRVAHHKRRCLLTARREEQGWDGEDEWRHCQLNEGLKSFASGPTPLTNVCDERRIS